MSEHGFVQLVGIADAPCTHAIEQCKRCGVVRITQSVATVTLRYGPVAEYSIIPFVPVQLHTEVRWFDKGAAIEPREECS